MSAANRSIAFFDGQFARQSASADYALNPFETSALAHLRGRVLDFGCGLGNLAVALARQGCEVLAVDASPNAVSDLAARATRDKLAIQAQLADAREYRPDGAFDSIACIGLLMFVDCKAAHEILGRLKAALKPGGVIAFNVLVEGTTFMDMFDASGHCLWPVEDVTAAFAGWSIVLTEDAEFPAPGGTVKRFCTVVARSPVGAT